MSARLGVDLGTTWTAAALERSGQVEPLALATHGLAMPSVLAVADGDVHAGERAERLLLADPGAGVRECKRRLGDSTPMVVAGTPYGAEALLGHLLGHVVGVATEREGTAPDQVTLTHPATWGDYKLDLLREAGRLAGVPDVALRPEPVAAALHYVRLGRVRAGETVAVYDFGGGTFDVAVVRCDAAGAEIVGTPDGIERLGGIDLDQAVVAHVDAALDGRLRELDADDADVRRGMVRLRAACTAAKEALSSDTEASVDVALPGLATQVRITRDELEAALRPRVADTLRALDRALASAGVTADALAGVLLVGGSSRIPMVGEEVARHTGRPTLLDADPKLVVALGASGGVVTVPTSDPRPVPTDGDGAPTPAAAPAAKPVVVVPPKPAAKKPPAKSDRGAATVAGGVGVAAAAAGAGYLGVQALRDDDDGEDTADDAPVDDELDVLGDPVDDSLDAFDDVAGGGGGGGGVRVAAGARSAGAPSRPARPTPDDADDVLARPAPQRANGPAAATPTSPVDPVAPVGPDPQVAQIRETLRARLEQLDLPDGADPAEVAELRAELGGLLDRFAPAPGQSVDDAVADLRQRFDDQVEDFVQDLKIDAIVEEQRRDETEPPADEPPVDEPTDEQPDDGAEGGAGPRPQVLDVFDEVDDLPRLEATDTSGADGSTGAPAPGVGRPIHVGDVTGMDAVEAELGEPEVGIQTAPAPAAADAAGDAPDPRLTTTAEDLGIGDDDAAMPDPMADPTDATDATSHDHDDHDDHDMDVHDDGVDDMGEMIQ